jgi:hypothetical protein
MAESPSKTNRRYKRIPTPTGIWVAWRDGNKQSVSRVLDLNVGGLYIVTPEPVTLGTVVTILLSVPEGEIRGLGTVRNVKGGEGMGVEFTGIAQQDAARLEKLVSRLLLAASNSQELPALNC